MNGLIIFFFDYDIQMVFYVYIELPYRKKYFYYLLVLLKLNEVI